MILARVRRIFIPTGGPGGNGYWRPELPPTLDRNWQHIAEGPPDGLSPNGYFLVALPDASAAEAAAVRALAGAATFRPDELARLPSNWRPLADAQLIGWERRGR